MFKLCFLLLTCLCIKTVYSAVAIQLPEKKPDAFKCQVGCYNSGLNMVLPVKERYSPLPSEPKYECLQYYCQEDNGNTQIFSCGAVQAGPGCQLVDGDKKAPYPGCCKSISCTQPANPEPATQTAVA